MITSSSILDAYHAAQCRIQQGGNDFRDTVIIALWQATSISLKKAEGLQQQLDKANEANAQSVAAVASMTMRLAARASQAVH